MKTFIFGIRDTPKGAVAWMKTPSGRLQQKRARNGYCCARVTAQRWIDEQIESLKEWANVEGFEVPEIIQTHESGDHHDWLKEAGEKPAKIPKTPRM